METFDIYTFDIRNWEALFANDVDSYLQDKGYNVEQHLKQDFQDPLQEQVDKAEFFRLIKRHLIVQHRETKTFFTINHADKAKHYNDAFIGLDHCAGTLKIQYEEGLYQNMPHKVKPFIYKARFREYDQYRHDFIDKKGTKRILHFRGNDKYSRAPFLQEIYRRGLLNDYFGFFQNAQKIGPYDFLKEMSEHKIALALPGHGNLCHRELEAFGIKTPVLMPNLDNQYYNDLIPGEHYIGFELSRYFHKCSIEEFMEKLEEQYYKYIDNDEELERIAENGMKWYEDNVVYPNNMILMEKILKNEFNYNL